MSVIFGSAPPMGTKVHIDGQTYELIAAEPYTRKRDGQPSFLLTWNTVCPADDCGVGFQATSGLTIRSLTRRCAAHADSKTSVTGKRWQRIEMTVEFL